MKTFRTIAVAIAVLFAGNGLALDMAQAQQPGVKRTDLQQHDLSVPGREVVQVRVDIAPGVLAPNHSHPGEEIVYVIEGLVEYQLEGRPACCTDGRDSVGGRSVSMLRISSSCR